jgi:hypothetical protein
VSRTDAQIHPVDVAVAVTAGALRVAAGAGRRAGSAIGPVAARALRPRLLPERLQPGAYLEAASRAGEVRRAALQREVTRQLDQLVPVVVDEVVRRIRLTELVLRYVDIDRVVDSVDLDAAVAKVDVAAVVDRVDLDRAVDRVDIDAAAARLDIDAVLDRIDLTALVLRRVDLLAIVQTVLDRLDLVGIAAEVIDGVDLPEIIRESTGSMASDTVRGVRMQGIAADEAVGRAVDRLLLRGRGRPHTST